MKTRLLKRCGILLLMAALLGGCGGGTLREKLGLVYKGPDPFRVRVHAPIVLPKQDALPEPEAGAPSPLAMNPQASMRALLNLPTVEKSAAVPGPAEYNLLTLLDARNASSGIRDVIDNEFVESGEEPLFLHRLFGLADENSSRRGALDVELEIARLRTLKILPALEVGAGH